MSLLPDRPSRRALPALLLATLLLATLLLTGGCSGEGAPAEAVGTVDGPLIVIAVDGLRTDRLGAYGAPEGSTPNLDALADQSLLFRWAFAQSPDALPSLVSALTGLYPATSGVIGPEDHLSHEAVTLAEALSEAGYTTAAFVLGEETSSDHGLAQGFERFVMSPDHVGKARAWMKKNAAEHFLLLVAGWPGAPAPRDLESARETGPVPPEASDRAYLRSVDAGVGEILGDLHDLGLDRSATLVFLGTTAASLPEPEALADGGLHAGTVRVPFMIRLPEGRKAGTVGRVVEVTALTPTLLDLVGAERPAAAQGASLLPVVDGSGRPPFIAFGQTPRKGGQAFAAEGGYQLLVTGGGESMALYNLADDPLATEDLSGAQGQRAEALRSHLEAWSKMVAVASLDPEQRSEEELDDETLEQLRSLGYIQ